MFYPLKDFKEVLCLKAQYMLVYTSIYWYIPACTSTDQLSSQQVQCVQIDCTYQYVLSCTGMCWYVLVCAGMCWYVLVCTNLDLGSKMVQTRLEPEPCYASSIH